MAETDILLNPGTVARMPFVARYGDTRDADAAVVTRAAIGQEDAHFTALVIIVILHCRPEAQAYFTIYWGACHTPELIFVTVCSTDTRSAFLDHPSGVAVGIGIVVHE